jgi:hypothetical protein
MARKSKLETTGFQPEGTLVGIATPLPFYRLVHFINKVLYTNLASNDDLQVFDETSGIMQSYPFYSYHHTDLRTDFYLFANYNGKSHVFPGLKQINYFKLLQGAAFDEHINDMLTGIRSIPGVQAAIRVQQGHIKNIAYFYEDFEMFLMELKKKESNGPEGRLM